MKKSQFKRNCPKCNKEIFYKNEYNLKRGIKNNTLCRFCNTSKENNGMYGKNHYNIWLEKYGKEEADKKLKSYKDKLYGDRFKELNRRGRFKGHKHTLKYRKHISDLYLKNGSPSSGTKRTRETKRKHRLTMIKRIEEIKFNGGQIHPGFNIIACDVIYWINKFYNYNFQHAMNGGEFRIKELGYWVDCYDKKKNIVIEFYERRHYKLNGELKERDIEREQEIIEYLNCEFVRINAFYKNDLILEKIN